MNTPSFSLTELYKSMKPWSVEIDGEVHVACDVSRMAILRFQAACERWNGYPQMEEQALRTLLRVAFPFRLRYAWRRRSDPVRCILGLGLAAREAALRSFFAALTQEQDGSGRTSRTGDADSSGATPPSPNESD